MFLGVCFLTKQRTIFQKIFNFKTSPSSKIKQQQEKMEIFQDLKRLFLHACLTKIVKYRVLPLMWKAMQLKHDKG